MNMQAYYLSMIPGDFIDSLSMYHYVAGYQVHAWRTDELLPAVFYVGHVVVATDMFLTLIIKRLLKDRWD